MLYKVLLVGCDDMFARRFEEKSKQLLNCDVLNFFDAAEALEQLRKLKRADLVIMEAMMASGDGYSVLRQIRKFRDVPVIMLSGRNDLGDKLYAFESGTNDYVVKPFDIQELIARAKALIELYTKYETRKLEFDGFEIDIKGRILTIDGQQVFMNAMDFDVLKCLVMSAGVALSRREILDRVWGYDYDGDTRAVDTHIKLVRKALGKYRDRILSHREYGYMFRYDPEKDVPYGWSIR